MKTTIQSIHFTPVEKLNDFLTEKLNELEQNYPTIITGVACLKLDKVEKVENKICEIKIEVSGYNLYVKKHRPTFEEAITEAIEALESEMSKHKN
jgi:ribosomal subunit interface protein